MRGARLSFSGQARLHALGCSRVARRLPLRMACVKPLKPSISASASATQRQVRLAALESDSLPSGYDK